MELTLSLEGFDQLEAALKRAPEIVAEELAKFAHASVNTLRSDIIDLTPVSKLDHTHMNTQYSSEVLGATSLGVLGAAGAGVLGIVGTVVPYAIPVELGTRPHIIRARNARALHFGNIFVKSVHHPGTKGAHMFQRAMDDNQAQIEADFAAAVERALQRIAAAGP